MWIPSVNRYIYNRTYVPRAPVTLQKRRLKSLKSQRARIVSSRNYRKGYLNKEIMKIPMGMLILKRAISQRLP